jgi:hypothetical protein
MPIFVTFSAWWAGTISQYSAGESPPIKAEWPVAMTHLATACGGINTLWEKQQKISEVWEKSAAVDSAEPNSKEMLPRMRQHFVDTRFLSTQDFCRREYFVYVSILLMPTFCRCKYFVYANILIMPTFCR